MSKGDLNLQNRFMPNIDVFSVSKTSKEPQQKRVEKGKKWAEKSGRKKYQDGLFKKANKSRRRMEGQKVFRIH